MAGLLKALPSIVAALAASVLALTFFGPSAFAYERILSYHSDITVNADSTMDVTETIRVTCENAQINHGIYRDFPTRYRDKHRNVITVGFRVTDVKRDGKPEPYFTENESNGIRVYVGNKDVMLKHGEYTYAIAYHTSGQLGFFADYDEIYWNATGNGWSFPIDKATATVTLPKGVPVDSVKLEAYAGPAGSQGRDYTASQDSQGRCVFNVTRPLDSGEGLTIIVTFPKGYVAEPSGTVKSLPARGAPMNAVGLLSVIIGALIFVIIIVFIIVYSRRYKLF